jgi:Cu(I)/Ag(I) efflux system membrane fusion protein
LPKLAKTGKKFVKVMKKYNWLDVILVSIVLGFGVVSFAGCSSDHAGSKNGKAAQYTCAMHPEVVKDNPGDCPKCGMKLVEKK